MIDIDKEVTIIGGGLAGCEAALQLAARGVRVHLFEMRPQRTTPVHKTADLAELVCSNSFKSTNIDAAAGLLKAELAILGSKLLELAFETRVPAGGALAVDREEFGRRVTALIEGHPLITLERKEVSSLGPLIATGNPVIVAAGPLCSESLASDISQRVGAEGLAFFDAAAPIVEASSLDTDVLFAQSRHNRGGRADYLNAPFSKEEYDVFIEELVSARKVISKDFERKELFQACQPIEEIARSGHDALRFGALKPIGLIDPRTGHRPWAAVQLRAENAKATAYNLVGFQTNLAFGEQERIFRLIPGLGNAEFSRFGVMHRNTFIDTPHVLDASFALKTAPQVRFAGQICGTEGYTEAIASGLFAALCTYAYINELPVPQLPVQSAFGALLAYATDPSVEDYQPMHVNFGIMKPLEPPIKKKVERYAAYSARARQALHSFREEHPLLAFLAYNGPDMQEVSDHDGRREA